MYADLFYKLNTHACFLPTTWHNLKLILSYILCIKNEIPWTLHYKLSPCILRWAATRANQANPLECGCGRKVRN